MRKILASIIFILVVVSFFYQYKYGVSLSASEVQKHEAPKEEALKTDLSKEESQKEGVLEVTPKPEVAAAALNAEAVEEMFSIHDNDIVLGNRDAKVILIEYSSLTCPHCSYFHKEVYPELQKKYIDTGKIAYVLREFVSNKQDLDGAILARCLDDKKDPLKLLNVLYAQQDNWAFNKNYREILENIGQLAGVSKEKFSSCLARSDLVQMLASNSRSITFYKEFVGTPAFVINGKMHKGIYDVVTLSNAIDEALDVIKDSSKSIKEAVKSGDKK